MLDSWSTPSHQASEFLVIHNGKVTGRYDTIEEAKAKLSTYPTGSSPSRMIAEVKDGTVLSDPHTVGGQNQGGGLGAGFNKWWGDWSDINRMVKVAQDYLEVPTNTQTP